MNRGNKQKQIKSEIYAEASEWLSKMDRGFTDMEEAAFESWKNHSEFHQIAFQEQQWNWEELDRLAGLHTSYGSTEDPNLLINEGVKVSVTQRNPFGKWMTIAALAACMVFAAISVIAFNRHPGSSEVEVPKTVVVERIETRHMEDGSEIQLNRGAEISVKYDKSKRLVHLLKGEASFEVAKDADRPFYVQVGDIQVRAVGTAFNVRFMEHEVDVIVAEGTVSVKKQMAEVLTESPTSEAEEAIESETILEANYRARVDLTSADFAPSVEPINASRIEEELIWKPVLIDFENVPLSKIVDEFNRRNPVKMVIVDQSVNDARLSSMFWSDNINGLIRLLESNFDIRATWGEDGTIYLFNGAD